MINRQLLEKGYLIVNGFVNPEYCHELYQDLLNEGRTDKTLMCDDFHGSVHNHPNPVAAVEIHHYMTKYMTDLVEESLFPTYSYMRIYNNNSFLIKHTDRHIIVREKSSNADLNDQIQGAWAVVTCQSTVAIKAIMKGVPSFCDEMSSALPLSLTDISMIENPKIPSEREIINYKNNLLANQFTMTEISKGLVYDIVRRLQGNRFYGN